ncbi:hypothetical protein K432DRAFT_400280 [Lepidopterella palustris CBS 459.81]|uniref:Uncharacterized protein n=1 Tax=Lepidopterella palustris CBS 459.81 TaxID=1314670 RepID=A0A8E2JK61_9PEZI|nr:hypothetical protein K432DRAFT_400280 [Lepidopterella palustris CBS 459.81]
MVLGGISVATRPQQHPSPAPRSNQIPPQQQHRLYTRLAHVPAGTANPPLAYRGHGSAPSPTIAEVSTTAAAHSTKLQGASAEEAQQAVGEEKRTACLGDLQAEIVRMRRAREKIRRMGEILGPQSVAQQEALVLRMLPPAWARLAEPEGH